jgi:Ca2+-transporting ATPase
MSASELVPGDVIYVRVGDKIPADARLLGLKTTTFKVDEGSLTGESVTVSKSTDAVAADVPIQGKTNMVFSGTMVTNGAAYAVVTATGMKTEIGKIQEGVQEAKEDQEKTPLAQKLDDFGNQLTGVIGGICMAVWLVSYPKFSSPIFGGFWKGALYYAKVAVALGVAAIPEGLPAVITLCLSLGTRRMAKRNVIVRKLPSVETLGCTTVICSDKTGTLTTNQMTSVSLVTVESSSSGKPSLKEFTVEGVSYDPKGEVVGLPSDAMRQPGFQDLARVCSICNDAQVVYDNGKFKHLGEPTEAALKVLVEKFGVSGLRKSEDLVDVCRQCNNFWAADYKKLATLEFSRD